jgi:FAD/FMN-containing dehydrogenase
MSASALSSARQASSPEATLPESPPLRAPAGVAAGAASLLAFGAAGAAVAGATSPALGVALADQAALVVGIASTLVQGANASDRRGRRRFILIGLALLALALGAHALAIPVATGLLLGLGSGMVALSAGAWLHDAHLGRIAGIVLALAATVGGAWVAPASWLVPAAVLVAAAAGVLLAPEVVRGPRTPVFVLPGRPDLGARPAALPVLVVLAGVFALFGIGLAAGLAVTAALTAVAAVVTVAPVARATRPRPSRPTPLADRGRGYSRAVSVFDASASPKPALATTVRSVEEVRAAIESARERGLSVAMHSTGHAAMGLAEIGASALLKVAIDGPITVDPERRLVRVPAGRAWGEVVPLLQPHGLAVPHGSSGHVGVVGYLTRGGLSAYGRRTGVAANWIESIEVVTADGRLVVASRENEPQLFWALRGGGGGFGVVTAVTVRAFEPGEVVTGAAVWEIDDAAAVADAWAQWSASAPSAVTTSLRILSVPPLPGMPLRLTGRPVLVVDGTAVDAEVSAREAAGELLARLRAAAAPRLDTWRVADALEVPHTHMDPPFSPAHSSAHALLGARDARDLDQARGVVSDFVAAAAQRDSGVSIAELRQLGGALADSPRDAGVVGHYRGAFGWLAIALHGKTGREVADAAIDAQRAELASWDTGYTAPTLAVERARAARSFPERRVEEVDAVRERFDPEGLFRVDIAPGARSRLG